MSDTTTPTSLKLPLTAFAAGGVVALLLGVFGRVHDPTLNGTTTLGLRTVIDMKVALSLVVGVLVLLQLVGALWLYGRLRVEPPSWLGPTHRVLGAVTLLLTVFVGYHCLWSLGLESGTLRNGKQATTRVVAHGVLGCAVFGAVVVKLVAVRSRRAAGWFLPVAGGLLFALIAVSVLTSAAWYVGAKGWPN